MREKMMKMKFVLAAAMCYAIFGFTGAAFGKPLKVFIIAGQSNAQGHAAISTFDVMADDPATAPLLRKMRGDDGTPHICENVWISSIGCKGDGWSDVIEQTGRLTAGFGASPEEIGPEFTFGILMEEAIGEPILIIKTAWGGRSLYTDFRPPSAGPETFGEFIRDRWKERGIDADEESARINANVGVFYRHMIERIRGVLKDIGRVVPDYDPDDGYELAGFVWFQGWNDYCDGWNYPNQDRPDGYDAYTSLLEQFIRDVRRDLEAPQMPFVIGVMGVGGEREGEKNAVMQHFREAQNAPTQIPEFLGNVIAVQTMLYWDDGLESLQRRQDQLRRTVDEENQSHPDRTPAERDAAFRRAMDEHFTPEEQRRMKGFSDREYHYLGAAKIMAPIGDAFAEAMLELLQKSSEKQEIPSASGGGA